MTSTPTIGKTPMGRTPENGSAAPAYVVTAVTATPTSTKGFQMTTYTTAELTAILKLHALSTLGDEDGKRAYLSGADLSGANLRGANLSRANLREANLIGANLGGADLNRANLRRANLIGANLYWAYLSGAYLSGADLSGANLIGANLGSTVAVQSGPLGSRKDYLVTLWHPEWEAEQVTAGCWKGTLAELENAVTKQHGDNKYGRQYTAAITYHRAMIEIAKGEAG